MKKFLQDILMENQAANVWCFARVLVACSFVAYFCDSGYILYHTGILDLKDFAEGLGILLTTGAAAIAAKQATDKPIPTDKTL